jgi:hypothetical protein
MHRVIFEISCCSMIVMSQSSDGSLPGFMLFSDEYSFI